MKKRLVYLGVMMALLLGLTSAVESNRCITIFTIGDSTCANKPLDNERLERGWGQALSGFFDSKSVVVDNHALNGRSSLSFRNEGHWQKVYERIRPGDYVFIQFGHNDQKTKADRHTKPGSSYDDQLRQYIRETREKGGFPVLLTSIVRRKFDEQGKLIDTHGDYIQAVRNVAEEMNVPLIDHNQSSAALVEGMGPDASKALFMWVEPGTNAADPKGKQDDTHLRAKGARAMVRLVVEEIEAKIPALKPFIQYHDLVVAQDGSGDFMTVQEAIDAVPLNRSKTTRIYIRKGTYKERILISEAMRNLHLIGEAAAETILTFDNYASKPNAFGENFGTFGSSSLFIYASDFTAENLTFENSAGNVGQAVAVMVAGDRVVFRNCRFLGNQDTLYTWGKQSRQYYVDCYIEGTVDFIFGSSTCVFERCEIKAKRAGGYLTAASTPEQNAFGYVFTECRLTADEGVEKVFLGRPWRPYAKTVFIDCEMGAHIHPAGWHNWNNKEAEAHSFYAESGSKGPGSKDSERVSWARTIKRSERKNFRIANVLSGSDDWNPQQ